jgi:serine/threonine protein kinase/WD40 repeat protein
MFLDPKRVEQVFADVLELTDADARAQPLNRECADDQALRRRVEELLTAYSDAGNFLEPPDSLAPRLLSVMGSDSPARPDVRMEQIKDDRREPVEPASGPLAVLERLGDFRIIREIGRGGMGVVYEAEQVSLGRHVALKLLRQQRLADAQTRHRFEREARAAARLHHTNIVPVFGVGEQEGLPYYVMQYIQGLGLDEVLKELKRLQPGDKRSGSLPHLSGGEQPVSRREVSAAIVARLLMTGEFVTAAGEANVAAAGLDRTVDQAAATPTPTAAPMPGSSRLAELSALWSSVVLPGSTRPPEQKPCTYWQSVALIGVQVAGALEYAHRQGVQHRDIKPSNLLMDTAGTVWVADFGLARAENEDHLTQTGDIVGTLRYLPPEAFEGKTNARSDIYSLGLTLHELLALRPAFDEADRPRLIKRVTMAEPPRLDVLNPAIPRDLVTIVRKATDREPGRRYATAGELADDLQRFVADEPILARRQTLVEGYVRWARHHPAIAVLGTVLTAVLVLATAASLIVAGHMSDLAGSEAQAAADERAARAKSDAAEKTALAALADADAARDAAQRQVVKFDITTAAQQAERKEMELALHWVAQAWQDDHARLKPGQQLDAGAEANHRLRLAAAIDRLPRLVGFCPHDKPVVDADCDPTGDRVVTIAATLTRDSGGAEFWTEQREHVARVWDAGRAELAYPPLLHGGSVTSAVFSADGGRIATSSADGTARVWDAATGKALYNFQPGGPVARVAFSPDGMTLAAAVGETVCRWDTTTGEPAGAPIAIGGPTDYVAYSPEGSKLVTVTLAGEARVWDAATDKAMSEPLPFLRFGEKDIKDRGCSQAMEGQRWPAFSPDGKKLAAADGFRIRVWSETATKVIPLAAPNGPLQILVAFSPDGRQLFFNIRTGEALTVYDLAAGKVVAIGNAPRMVCGLAVSPNGKRAAVPLSVGNTVLFDLPSAAVAGPPLRIVDWVSRVLFTRDCRRLMTASWDGTVRLWQLAENPALEPYRKDCGRADRLEFPNRRFSPDGRWVAVSDAPHGLLRVGRTGGELSPLPGITAERYRFSPDGHLVTFHRDDKGKPLVLTSWELSGERPRSVGTTTIEGSVHTVAFSADGRRLGVSVQSKTFKPLGAHSEVDQFYVFDFPSLEVLLGPVGEGLPRLTGSFVLAGDGGLLVVNQRAAPRLACWDVRTGERLPGAAIKGGVVYSSDIGLGDGRVLVALSDSTITQWDARTGRRAGPTILLPSSHGTIVTAAYSPDQTRIAQTMVETVAGQPVSRVNVFSALDGDLLATTSLNRYLHLPDVWFSADNRRVILHQKGTTDAWSWTLPSYRGPLEEVPALVRLLTGTGSDPVGGFFPLQGDEIRSDPEIYRRAFRAWKGSTDRTGLPANDFQLHLALGRTLAEGGKQHLAEKQPSKAQAELEKSRAILQRLLSRYDNWKVLAPVAMKTETGAKMELQEDGSIFVHQPRPAKRDTYSLVLRSEMKGIAALRLEVLADSRLPGGGPGWNNDGNFVLHELTLSAASAESPDKSRVIVLQNPCADFVQWDANLRGLVDGRLLDGQSGGGWAVWPEFNKDHTAVFDLAEKVGDGRPVLLTCCSSMTATGSIVHFGART